MNKISTTQNILSKFRGCLLGGFIGDCCGAPYIGEKLEKPERNRLHKSLNELEAKKVKVLLKPYTDDTLMTMAVAKCLIEHKSLPHRELASQFCKSYFSDPNRNFGDSVPNVIHKLRQTKLENPLQPAKQLFNGSGSYGNGAAKRISPVGLFCFNDSIENIIKLARESAVITHSNNLGVNGAILQAVAINYCLKMDASTFNTDLFLDYIRNQLKIIEKEDDSFEIRAEKNFQTKIDKILELLRKQPSNDMVVNYLGNSSTAEKSVPTALFCFLKAQKPIEGIETENVLRRTIQYAIHLGGQTHTIANMAGSLAGALNGEEIISKNILSYCEANEEVSELANLLYKSIRI